MSFTEVMVVAGEASGDQHAAEVVAALRALRPDLRFFGMGGPRLQAQQVDLIYPASEVSVMGFTEVLPKIPRLLQVMNGLARVAARRQPAAALLVDIPDFNLRLAARLKALGIPIAYYVSPMIWAWRRGRVHVVGERVDKMLCILPFEERFYRQAGVWARYVGSPVLEQVPAPAPVAHFREQLGLAVDRPTVALLPGSRPGELRRLVPTLAQAGRLMATARPGLQLVVPRAPTIERVWLEAAFAPAGLDITFIDGRAPEAVGASDVAVVASGTATLEAGLMGRPLVVVYRVSALNYLIGRALIEVDHISLVNLLAGKRLVPELLQGKLTPARVAAEVERLWSGPARDEVVAGLEKVRAALGPLGAASNAAREVLTLLP